MPGVKFSPKVIWSRGRFRPRSVGPTTWGPFWMERGSLWSCDTANLGRSVHLRSSSPSDAAVRSRF
eukprot:15216285-Alexandrium_andersonii.AAC.1